ncbi:MAG: ParA family protein [Leptospiraceae bacterium]|nr:ParA family protein [Leptospiraceae bacterium]
MIVSFFNRKGGVGKTSISFLVSKYLAATGARVLYLDLDPQRTATSHFERREGLDHDALKRDSVFDVLLGRRAAAEVIVPAGDMFLLPGSFDVAEIQATVGPFAMRDILKDESFDFCIVDHAPNWSALIQSGLFASDCVVVPTQAAVEDMEQAEWSVQKVRQVSPEAKIGVLLNQYAAGKLEREVLDAFALPYLETTLPRSGLVRRYTATGEGLNTRAKAKAAFAGQIAGLVSEITGTRSPVEAF